jgi:DNA-binding XRE family transcriptional regulator
MVENGQRNLSRLADIVALANALDISPAFLAFGGPDAPVARPGPLAETFPVAPDVITARRHARLAGRLAGLLAASDTHAAGDWLRQIARQPGVNPWLLIDQLSESAVFRVPIPGDIRKPAAPEYAGVPAGDRSRVRRLALTQRRTELGYSQEALANEIRVERTTVARWERGASYPQPWIRPRLAKALRITAEELADLLNCSAPGISGRPGSKPHRRRCTGRLIHSKGFR